jgi:hypothetical protein
VAERKDQIRHVMGSALANFVQTDVAPNTRQNGKADFSANLKFTAIKSEVGPVIPAVFFDINPARSSFTAQCHPPRAAPMAGIKCSPFLSVPHASLPYCPLRNTGFNTGFHMLAEGPA